MKISNYVNRVAPSLARALFNLAKQYADVIDLTLGDPDFSTPDHISQAACDAIWAGKTHYSANAGLPETRKAIAKHVSEVWGIEPDVNSELIATVGGMEALFLSLASMIDPGDEVIIFAPYYVNYVQMVRFLNGVPVIIDSYDKDKGICIDEQLLRSRITDKTVAMIVNTPNNPTGDMFGHETMEMLAQIVREKNIAVISDEVYRTLIFDDTAHESFLQFEDIRDNVILIDSASKEFCMTGWRIGYAFGPKELIQNMVKLQENVAACASLPSQFALIEAYNSNVANTETLTQFKERCDVLHDAINRIDKLSALKPKATFYMFVNISQTGMSSLDFAMELLKAEHVAVVPGETYGESYKDYIRIAFTRDVAVLRTAAERIAHFVNSL